ncbi:MAG: cytochrome c-type biogenesis protein CcmH [Alphaproteobacteria bacterium]|nr:cytochrome c-type biogenesis protein CcmH [Alphaproteobacteria bacterium]
MRLIRPMLFGLAALLTAFAAAAVQPDEMLKDPAQESRARALSAEIRCLVCQNQSIDDSDASLARDLRLLVRDQISQGRSDGEIRDFLVERYGAFVLLDPPFRGSTLVLWLGPAIVLLAGAAGLAIYFRSRRRSAADAVALSDDERARLERLLDDRDRRA